MNKTQEQNKARKVAFRDMQDESRGKHVRHINYVKREDEVLSYSKFRFMIDLRIFDV